MIARALFVLACGVSSVGCGFTELHEVVLRKPGPPSARVEVYVGNQVPPRPFYEVALLQAVGHGGDANIEDTTRAIEQRAIVLGCDAVVKLRFDQGYSMANAVGVCVRWAAPAPAASVTAPAPAPTEPEPEPSPSSPQSI